MSRHVTPSPCRCASRKTKTLRLPFPANPIWTSGYWPEDPAGRSDDCDDPTVATSEYPNSWKCPEQTIDDDEEEVEEDDELWRRNCPKRKKALDGDVDVVAVVVFVERLVLVEGKQAGPDIVAVGFAVVVVAVRF